MAEITLTKTRIRAGIWEGVLAGSPEAPALEVLHLERPVAGVTVAAVPERPGGGLGRVAGPAEGLSEGVQTFLIRDDMLDFSGLVRPFPREVDPET